MVTQQQLPSGSSAAQGELPAPASPAGQGLLVKLQQLVDCTSFCCDGAATCPGQANTFDTLTGCSAGIYPNLCVPGVSAWLLWRLTSPGQDMSGTSPGWEGVIISGSSPAN